MADGLILLNNWLGAFNILTARAAKNQHVLAYPPACALRSLSRNALHNLIQKSLLRTSRNAIHRALIQLPGNGSNIFLGSSQACSANPARNSSIPQSAIHAVVPMCPRHGHSRKGEGRPRQLDIGQSVRRTTLVALNVDIAEADFAKCIAGCR